MNFYERGRSTDEIYEIKTNNVDSDIMRVRYFSFKESPSWSDDFQQNAKKVGFILKSVHVYMETFDQNLTL